MERGVGYLGQGLRVCGYERCGKSFAAPVRLTDLSHKPRSETYYACPYCFSKTEETSSDESAELKLVQSEDYEIAAGPLNKGIGAGALKEAEKDTPAVSCPHHVGYLKTRSKSEAVPDSCLTCPKILQCMV